MTVRLCVRLVYCDIWSKVARPGASATIAFAGFQPNATIAIGIGGNRVAITTAGAGGTGTATATIPSNTSAGLRLVALSVPGTLRVAFCAVRIAGGSTTPATIAAVSPQSDPAGWNNSNVTVTLSASPVVGGADISRIFYQSVGGQTIASTSSTSNPVSFQLTKEGTTTVSFHAVDAAGTAENTESLIVRIDETQPTIAATVSPAPNAAGWYGLSRTPVKISYQCSDQVSGILNCSSPASVSSEGKNQTIMGTAVDQALNRASVSSTISVDVTPPLVTYSGNAGTYTVDQDVAISCSATDNLSGVASDTCAPISGPAYTFNIGINNYSATATDYADNSGTGQVSFQVKVTYASLCNLTERFSTSDGIAGALCKKLSGAEAAEANGNESAKMGKLHAYTNQLDAQIGKAFTAAQVTLLERLVTYL